MNITADITGVEGAARLYNHVNANTELSLQSAREGGCSPENAVLPDDYILGDPTLGNLYITLLMSPRMTVPPQMIMSTPKVTSPITLASGAMK